MVANTCTYTSTYIGLLGVGLGVVGIKCFVFLAKHLPLSALFPSKFVLEKSNMS